MIDNSIYIVVDHFSISPDMTFGCGQVIFLHINVKKEGQCMDFKRSGNFFSILSLRVV